MKLVLPALICSFLVLTGCAAPRIEGDVTTFHDQVVPAGETIRVMPADPDKVGSLEFRTYANRISEELRKAGYTPVTETDVVTDLIAEVDYFVEQGTTEFFTDRSSVFMGYNYGFGGFGRRNSPWNLGVFAPIWTQPDVYSTQFYQRSLELNIVKAGDEQERIFESRVESNGTESALNVIMPYLITAMFTDFPGQSGTTKVVRIETE